VLTPDPDHGHRIARPTPSPRRRQSGASGPDVSNYQLTGAAAHGQATGCAAWGAIEDRPANRRQYFVSAGLHRIRAHYVAGPRKLGLGHPGPRVSGLRLRGSPMSALLEPGRFNHDGLEFDRKIARAAAPASSRPFEQSPTAKPALSKPPHLRGRGSNPEPPGIRA